MRSSPIIYPIQRTRYFSIAMDYFTEKLCWRKLFQFISNYKPAVRNKQLIDLQTDLQSDECISLNTLRKAIASFTARKTGNERNFDDSIIKNWKYVRSSLLTRNAYTASSIFQARFRLRKQTQHTPKLIIELIDVRCVEDLDMVWQ